MGDPSRQPSSHDSRLHIPQIMDHSSSGSPHDSPGATWSFRSPSNASHRYHHHHHACSDVAAENHQL